MKNNYIIIGDSIIYGVGGYEHNGWVSMLKNKLLNAEGTKESTNFVHCVGFPGATSKDIVEKFNSIVDTYYSSDMNNTFIIAVGINDTQVFNGSCKSTIDEYRDNIVKMINILKKKDNCKIIFIGLTRIEDISKPLCFKPSKFYDYKIILEYDNCLSEICKSENIEYVSMIDVLDSNDFVDGLHPNDSGYSKMYEKVLSVLDY